MSRIKMVLDIVKDLVSLSDSLSSLAEAMIAEDEAFDEGAQVDELEVDTEDEDITPLEPEKPSVPLETVRAAMATKSREGHGEEVRAILAKYGAAKLSAVNPIHFAVMLEEVQKIG